MHAEPAIVATAMRSGANGYVLKSNTGADLLTALEAVMSGSIHMPPSLAARQLGSLSRPLGVTDRQHSVLKLIAKGRVTKEIARELGLSARTVEAHRYSMMQTLHVHSALELVRTAAALGLLAVADVGMGDL
jgi:DNA-binding NarL/FixJ family response regulator